ncbi:hypothetical protein P8C59_000321 [Phyllachora maydis]|uniref:Uncharacterized protein n=1 Tax=Phyllachora maydis TaxID=1825666 RepID=A0AAD9MB26_9PEZI|nr:hypothetical protein P8C59_000321 [Phyllachora maydis]
MAGRKRRFSESSVEPPKVNKSKIKWLKEIKVSRHRNPFQILVLKDVIIYRNDLNTMDLKEQQKHLLDPRFRDAHIEIRNSGTFAIGTGDCELPVFCLQRESAGSTGHITLKNVAKRPKLHKKLKRTKLAQIFWLYARTEFRNWIRLTHPDILAYRNPWRSRLMPRKATQACRAAE